MEKSSISCFSSLINLENFFCINRTYLLPNRRKRILGNIITIITLTVIIAGLILNVVSGVFHYEMVFQGVLAFELAILAHAARYRHIAFLVYKSLDEKYGAEKTYLKKLRNRVQKETFIAVVSLFVDIIGIYTSNIDISTINKFMYLVFFASHEAETVFYALIIEGMNLRLLKLDKATVSAGSRLYGHVLMASSQINIEFTPKCILMTGIVLATSVTYATVLLLMFIEKGHYVAVYLLWRQLKTMYCLSRLCRAAFTSDSICQQLTFQLAKKLAFDPAFDKAKHPQAYSVLNRWYTTILEHRPKYVRGSVLSIGLSIPLYVVDITINYVLIIIQIYVAYK